MNQIDNTVLDSLIRQAQASPRRRAHFNLHPELNDSVQRLCIAMEPGTYVRPHRHSDPETWEILVILRGSLALTIFGDQGMVVERTVLRAGGPVTVVEFPRNTWHAPVSLETGTVVFEIKQGPYRPIAENNMAAWAPAEGMPAVSKFLEWFSRARIADMPPQL